MQGKNFGCGSSREHAPIALKASGVSCVIAATFARIFYRNAINIGLPILECPQAAAEIGGGDQVSVDFDTGLITDETTGKNLPGPAFSAFYPKNHSGGWAACLPFRKKLNRMDPRGAQSALLFCLGETESESEVREILRYLFV